MLNVMDKGMILEILKYSVKQLEAKVEIHRMLPLLAGVKWLFKFRTSCHYSFR